MNHVASLAQKLAQKLEGDTTRRDHQAPTAHLLSTIIKRDGAREPFDAGRIARAIEHAGSATSEFGGDEAERLARRVLVIASATTHDEPTVEGIQDLVEEVLIASPYRRSARAYILYREQHRVLRELQSSQQAQLVDSYLDQSDWQVMES
jgi:ribonucleoside-triphosphate reductase (formate)